MRVFFVVLRMRPKEGVYREVTETAERNEVGKEFAAESIISSMVKFDLSIAANQAGLRKS
jgi:hypothetical protein